MSSNFYLDFEINIVEIGWKPREIYHFEVEVVNFLISHQP